MSLIRSFKQLFKKPSVRIVPDHPSKYGIPVYPGETLVVTQGHGEDTVVRNNGPYTLYLCKGESND